MKKAIKILSHGIFISLFLFGLSYAYTIDDVVGDKIGGPDFEIYGIDVNLSNPSLITFSLYTNYPQSGVTVGTWATFVGDLAIDLPGGSSYEYGISLSSHANGIVGGNLYQVSNWNLSNFYAPSGGYSYNQNQIVTIGSGTDIGNAAISWNPIGSNPTYRIDVSVDRNLIPADVVDIHWASATCANDYVNGTAAVPEPSGMLLLGLGLITISGIVRKAVKVVKEKQKI
jgi:hypothetical protein